jgi:hypothetical protein
MRVAAMRTGAPAPVTDVDQTVGVVTLADHHSSRQTEWYTRLGGRPTGAGGTFRGAAA